MPTWAVSAAAAEQVEALQSRAVQHRGDEDWLLSATFGDGAH
jgi:hypothetical protein